MRHHLGKAAGIAAAATIVSVASIGIAQAGCTQASLTGTWYSGVIAEFAATSGGGGWTGTCTFTIKSDGTYTGSCTSQGTKESAPTTDDTVHGTLKTNSHCEITGTMSATGVHDTKVTSGIVVGNQAFISGARDKPATQVRLLTMVKRQDQE